MRSAQRVHAGAAGNSLGPTPPDSLGGAERIFARPDIGVAMLARTAALFVPCMCRFVATMVVTKRHREQSTDRLRYHSSDE
jgi:hypothetical protein